MDSLGFTWTHLDSLGLTWTHLDSPGLTWTRFGLKGKEERKDLSPNSTRQPDRAHALTPRTARHETISRLCSSPQPPISLSQYIYRERERNYLCAYVDMLCVVRQSYNLAQGVSRFLFHFSTQPFRVSGCFRTVVARFSCKVCVARSRRKVVARARNGPATDQAPGAESNLISAL